MKEFIEIPFGAKDSELGGWEYTIPEGFVASIEDGKIIVKKEGSEDDRIRKEIIYHIQHCDDTIDEVAEKRMLAWLEKQGESKFEQYTQEGDKIVTNEDGTHFNISQLERVAKKEPKFKVGDYLVNDYCKGKVIALTDRVQPQWKPSEEQIKAIRLTISFLIDDFNERQVLVELENQLKKLREE